MATYENAGQLKQAGRTYPQDVACAPERVTIGSLLEQLKEQAARLENGNNRIANALGGPIPCDSASTKPQPIGSVEAQLYEIGSLISAAIMSCERALQILGA